MNTAADSFEAHRGAVYGWAYRLLGHHHDALDVVQDVFLRWARQCDDAPPDRPRGWLRRVTLNLAIDRRRQAATSRDARSRRAGMAVCDEALPTADDGLRDDVQAALAGLTDAQRGVLVAKVFDEMTFAEIAEEFGVAVSTAKTHYLRAVWAVRDRLAPRWATMEDRRRGVVR